MHLHRPYRRFLPCRRFSWPPSCNLDIWIDSDRWIKFQEFQYLGKHHKRCADSLVPLNKADFRNILSGLLRCISQHISIPCCFSGCTIGTRVLFDHFRGRLALRYGFIGTAQTMALYLSDAIHSDPSSDPVERQKYRMAVTYLQLPDLGV